MDLRLLILRDAVDRSPDLVHRVRGLRFFLHHIEKGIGEIAGHEGYRAVIDEKRAARLFLSWVDDVNAQKEMAAVDRRDYMIFSAGLLLRCLIAETVIRVEPGTRSAAGQGVVPNPLVAYWPEGYFATVYCLTVLDVVMRQEGMPGLELRPEAGDLRTWASFRENCREAPSLAVPFLDLFLGNQPNWTLPTDASARPHTRLLS